MKKLLISSLIAMLTLTSSLSIKASTTYHISASEWQDFYKHLGNTIKYPSKAVDANLQGNSLITFTINKGKLKDLSVKDELGYGCDTEVLNRILSFPNFATAKDGNYALKTSFKLEGSGADIKNEDVKIPIGYTKLEINIIGFSPKAKVVSTSSVGKNSNLEQKSTFEVRGINKRSAEDVLIVLNGEILENSNLNVINPNQIESLDILKDASAIGLFGEKGKNGVIIVTTKKNNPDLSGKITGISIKKADDSETKTNVTIRGEKAWDNEKALIVIDGEIAALNSVSPNNVETVSILKDASSTALYGDKGKNGVIIITTKKETVTGDPTPNEDKKEQKSGIIFRGKNIGIGQEPLYVVDGEITEDISTIAPDNIKEINVTKTANGILSYGDKGKYGVIEITTKNATKKKP